jgi:hypothetical protein
MGGTGSDTNFWRDCESAPDQSDAAKTKEMKKLRKKLAALKQQVAGSKINLEVTTILRSYRPLFCCICHHTLTAGCFEETSEGYEEAAREAQEG